MIANLIYLAALAVASPWILFRMVHQGRYRRGLSEKLFGLSRKRAQEMVGDNACVWFHAVSVGEVNLLPNLVRRFEIENRDCNVVISTSTDTGYDLAVKFFGSERVFFCPLDFTWAVNRTLANLKPEQLVLAELELWPNLIRLARKTGAQVLVANARLSERSSRGYQRFKGLTAPMFRRLHWVGCQDQATAERFVSCGAAKENVDLTGSIKFDDAPVSRDNGEVQSRVDWAGISPWHRVWVLGSSGPGEEKMAIDVYRKLQEKHPELRLVIVPRHVPRFDAVAELIRNEGFEPHRRSDGDPIDEQAWHSDTIILVDTIGELRHWWGVGHIATVGGSFGKRGGQNMLEPAGYGLAVSFGSDTKNFRQIADRLLEADAAVRVNDITELHGFVHKCLVDIPAADALGRSAQHVIASQRGATERTVNALTRVRHKQVHQVVRSAA